MKTCSACGSLDTQDPCAVCAGPARDGLLILRGRGGWGRCGRWSGPAPSRGRYHVLGGLLSALDVVGPDALRIGPLVRRASEPGVREVILAPANVDGQTTAQYLAEWLADADVSVTMPARGAPRGCEFDWLDDGAVAQALRARRPA